MLVKQMSLLPIHLFIKMISAYLTETKCLDMFALFIQLAKNALIKAEHPSTEDILSKLSAQESITQQELKKLINDLLADT